MFARLGRHAERLYGLGGGLQIGEGVESPFLVLGNGPRRSCGLLRGTLVEVRGNFRGRFLRADFPHARDKLDDVATTVAVEREVQSLARGDDERSVASFLADGTYRTELAVRCCLGLDAQPFDNVFNFHRLLQRVEVYKCSCQGDLL